MGVEGVVPPEPVQGLSGSPGSGLKKPPRSLGRRGRESQGAGMPHPNPDKLPRGPRPIPCPNSRGPLRRRWGEKGEKYYYSSTQRSKVPTGGKGLWERPKKIKHRYQPRIQEWGLAEAWIGVHWAAGGKIAQRESTYKRHRIREREQVAHPEGKLGRTAH